MGKAKKAKVVFGDIFMDPDTVGESAYRALFDHAAEIVTPEGGNALTPVDTESVLSVDNLALLEEEFINVADTATALLKQIRVYRKVAERLETAAQVKARKN